MNWIRADEEKPKSRIPVICCSVDSEGADYYVARWWEGDRYWYDNYGRKLSCPDFWMYPPPLPEPPK